MSQNVHADGFAEPSRGAPAATVIIAADSDRDDFARRLNLVLSWPDAERLQMLVVYLAPDREAVEAGLRGRFLTAPPVSLALEESTDHLARVLSHVRAERVAFLPAGSVFSRPQWGELPAGAHALMVCVSEVSLPTLEWREHTQYATGWLTSTALLRAIRDFGAFPNWKPLALAAAARRCGLSLKWLSPRATTETNEPSTDAGSPAIGKNSTVLALVPHYRCEEWLGECLESLVTQSHPLTAIAVIDDASAEPPVKIVERFPQVTLLTAAENVGAYRLCQQVVDETAYDAYLLHDADDWSACDRLEIQLGVAEKTGAEFLCTQELRAISREGEFLPVNYPLDVNRAQAENPGGYCHINGSSLVSGNLLRRLGGFATGIRLAADMELLTRASHAARVLNIPRYCYYRRDRAASITSAPETGYGSPLRDGITRLLNERARSNATLALKGEPPDLSPCAVAGPVRLTHVLGPALKPA